MARAGAALGLDEPIVSAALVAAQATGADARFRQRDVRFFVELFSNWLEASTGEREASIHNTQVQRCLHDLLRVHWAERVGRTPPRWRLTAEGLMGLLRRLVYRSDLRRLDEFFLVHHFLDAYGARLRALVQEGSPGEYGPSWTADLHALLSPTRLLQRERARVAQERKRLQARADEARRSSALAKQRLATGAPLAEVVAEIEQRYPYELNSQRPFGELLSAMPTPFRRDELVEVAQRRADGLFAAQEALLAGYDGVLAQLQAGSR